MIVAEKNIADPGSSSPVWFEGLGALWEAVDTTARTPRILGTFDADDQTEADMLAHERWPDAVRVETRLAPPPAPVTVTQTQVVTPTAPPLSPSVHRAHTVQAGEYLSAIAVKYRQSASAWRELYDLNRDIIGSNPNLIRAGMTLRLPASWGAAATKGSTAAKSSALLWVLGAVAASGVAYGAWRYLR